MYVNIVNVIIYPLRYKLGELPGALRRADDVWLLICQHKFDRHQVM